MATDGIPTGHQDKDHQPASQGGLEQRSGVPRWALAVGAVLVVGVVGYLIWPSSPAPHRASTPVVAAKMSIEELRSDGGKGNVAAQFDLGRRYAEGDGVARDPVEAVKWFRQAAGQGHAGAQVKLGWAYAAGEGVAKDPVEAVKWFRKATDQGEADGQITLGFM